MLIMKIDAIGICILFTIIVIMDMKKLPAVWVLLILFTGVVYMAGARTFLQDFGYSFGLWQ